ncbi:MAG TPA: YbaB/EbfC family nucleoid-associated protein [Candidatus Dormibacteraeota bacterium]|nr:YbaB/EbfC family nucleoid-associated protein [Candidatus Dormibacteraeota bacterium]
MMKQLQQMQTKMARMQEELETVEVTGTAGGGAITVTANGHQRLLAVAIEPEVLEEGAELLADMVLAAVNDALDRSRELASQQMGSLTAGLGLPPGLL